MPGGAPPSEKTLALSAASGRRGSPAAADRRVGGNRQPNLLQVLLLRRYEGLFPFDRTYLKPLGAGVGAMPAMAALRPLFSGATLLLVGSLAGLVAFVGCLRALGIEPRDRYVWRALRGRYGTLVRRLTPGWVASVL